MSGYWRALLLLVSGCASGCMSLADRIAEPRSQPVLDPGIQQQFNRQAGVERHFMTTADGVALSYLTLPAGRREWSYSFKRTGQKITFNFNVTGEPEPIDARGTIVWLHGWNMDATFMLPWALQMSEFGYQAVLPDLRSHGRSARAPAGYGIREADDLAALVDELQRQGDLEPPVYLFGVSYGGVTSLFAERRLRDHVSGIVALEPYANAADAVHGMVAAATRPAKASSWRQRILRSYLRRRLDTTSVDRAIDQAGDTLSLALAEVDVTAAVTESTTCILLAHGAADRVVPVDVSRRLATLSERVVYAELADENHLSLPLRLDWLAAPLADWLHAARHGADCPDLQLPDDPMRQGHPAP